MIKKVTLISLLLLLSVLIIGATYTDRIEKGFVEYWIKGSTSAYADLDSLDANHLVINTNIVLDAAAGDLLISDGSSLTFTDGAETDSTTITHDGASFVVTGDDATDNLELEGLGLELENGGLMENPHEDSITLAEAFVKVEGALQAIKTTEQLRLSYDATNYLTITLADDGHTSVVTIDPDGAEADINFNPDGNVGIKTANPSVELEVTGAGKFSTDLEVTGGDVTGANGNAIDIGEATDGTITFSRDDAGTVTLTSADDDANAALTIAAGGTGALTLGDGGSTTAITSSDWTVSATGDMSGIGSIALDSTIAQTGTMTNGINMTGTYSDHVIDIQPGATMGDNKAIYIGTWGTEAEMNDGGGLFRIYGKVNAGGTATANIFVRTLTESTSPPISAQFYTDVDAADSASAPHTMDGIDVYAIINADKYFAGPANDSLDMLQGMRAAWFKVGASTTSHIYGNVATIWVDNQLNCTPTGREYAIFSTCGGSKPDAWAGFETTSSGWSYLFEFDKTAYDHDPVGSGNASTGSTDYYLKVNINGTAYGIQLYAL